MQDAEPFLCFHVGAARMKVLTADKVKLGVIEGKKHESAALKPALSVYTNHLSFPRGGWEKQKTDYKLLPG